MKTVNMHAAKTHLSRLVDEAMNGEEIIIARAGRPVARLVRLENALEEAAERRRRSLGSWKGQFEVPDDFNDLPDDIARAFDIDPDEERRKRRALEKRGVERMRRARKASIRP